MRPLVILIVLLVIAAGGGYAWDQAICDQVQLRLRVIEARLASSGTLHFDNLQAHPWGRGSVDQLHFNPTAELRSRWGLPRSVQVLVDHVEVLEYREQSPELPLRLRARLTGVHLPIAEHRSAPAEAADPAYDALPTLSDIGYREFRFDADLDLRYLPADGSLTLQLSAVDPAAVKVDAACTMQTGQDFADFFAADWRQLVISRCQLELHDRGLLRRTKSLMAARGRSSDEGLEQALMARLDNESTRVGLQWPPTTLASMQQFIHESRALRVLIDPPGNLQVQNLHLFAPRDLPQTLGLEISIPPDDAASQTP